MMTLRPIQKHPAARSIAKERRYLQQLSVLSERRDHRRMSDLPTRGRVFLLIQRARCRVKAKEAAGRTERFPSLT